jgi:glycosyltransferase involved in cell wall biosynthesis
VAEVAESATGRWSGQNRLRARVVPNFIPDDLVVDEIAVPAPDAPFLYVGDLSRDKGVHILLEAFDTLDGATSLILAGRSVDAAASRLSPAARWVGELPHEDVLRLYRSARAVIVPSVWPDPCPTVVLEAMAAGRPVVAAASGGIVDLVDHGRTGILIPPGDSAALALALGAIIDDPVTAAAMGAAGRDRVRSFTVSSVVRSIEEIYAECVDCRNVGIHR